VAIKFYTMAPDIGRDSVWNLLHFTLLAPRILRWLLDFWKVLYFSGHLVNSFFWNHQNVGRRDSVVSTVTRLRAGQLRNCGSIPSTCKRFLSSPKFLYRFWGLSACSPMGTWDSLFAGVNDQCMKLTILLYIVLKFRNDWSYICTQHFLYGLLRDV
jgi:hypothetical protein